VKIIQTWDDGLVSDLRLTELLRRYGARATFCLSPGLHRDERSFGWVHEGVEVWRLASRELVPVYEDFEICSHSLTHPRLTGLPADRLDEELRASRCILEELFRRPVRGFVYPFNASSDEVRGAVRAAGYLWARGDGLQADVYPPADPLDFHPSCHVLDRDFWRIYEERKAAKGLFFFWGHSCELDGGDRWEAFAGTLSRIAADPGTEWCSVADLFA
jgi:peptidoglycan/xylan/chitin deacetylase (PgdA/CDA1 family)